MTNKNLNYFSKKIKQINFYDSIVEISIGKNNELRSTKLLENNKKVRDYFTDYRHKGNFINTHKKFEKVFGEIKEKTILYKIIRKIFHRNLYLSLKEKIIINNYKKILRF